MIAPLFFILVTGVGTQVYFTPLIHFGGYPYGNSTHRSSTPGDTFTFRFTGALGNLPEEI
jgi:hypothetical protein